MYSRDPKTNHLKTGIIRKPDLLEVSFQMVQISNVWDHSYSYGPNFLKHRPFKMAASISLCI